MTHLLVGSAEWEVCPWKKRKCAQIWAEEASDSFDFLLVSAVSRKCDSDRAAAPLTSESILMCEEADKWRQEDTAPTQWTRDARPWWCSGWRTAAIEGFPSDVLIHLPSSQVLLHRFTRHLRNLIGWNWHSHEGEQNYSSSASSGWVKPSRKKPKDHPVNSFSQIWPEDLHVMIHLCVLQPLLGASVSALLASAVSTIISGYQTEFYTSAVHPCLQDSSYTQKSFKHLTKAQIYTNTL